MIEIKMPTGEQYPCEDCISREAVDEYITNLLSGYLYDEERTRLEDLTAFVWELPSVTPQPKIGKWIRGHERHFLDARINVNVEMKKDTGKGYHTYINAQCSKCRMITIHDDSILYEYCPHCGARMAEAEMEESDADSN